MRSTAATHATHPLPPDAALSLLPRLRAIRAFHTGPGLIRDTSGPVAMVRFGPSRLFPPFAVVTSPQGAKDVLGGADSAFDKQGVFYAEGRALGLNVFNVALKEWRPRRRTLQPLFTKQHVGAYAGHMADAAEAAARQWVQLGRIDLDEQCRQLTLRVLGRSMFGLDLGERAADLGPRIRRTLLWISRRSARPVRAPRWLATPARRRLQTARVGIRAVIDEAIVAARDDPGRDAELIRLLLGATDPETGQPLSQQAIGDELAAFLVAGHDTTATVLAYGLWALGRNPAIQARVAAEVAELGDRPLTVADVPRLTYTVQVIHETLRMCPPAPAISRMAVRDGVVDGYLIPAGTTVVIGTYALHHDPQLWPDPSVFDPDRFGSSRSSSRDRWQFLPFGGGPRTCIGDHFAMLEAVLGLASIIRVADITALDDEFPLALPFTMTAGGPIRASVSARQAGGQPD